MRRLLFALFGLTVALAMSMAGCTPPPPPPSGDTGSVALDFTGTTLPAGTAYIDFYVENGYDTVFYRYNVTDYTPGAVYVDNIPNGSGYRITALTVDNDSSTWLAGQSSLFSVNGTETEVNLALQALDFYPSSYPASPAATGAPLSMNGDLTLPIDLNADAITAIYATFLDSAHSLDLSDPGGLSFTADTAEEINLIGDACTLTGTGTFALTCTAIWVIFTRSASGTARTYYAGYTPYSANWPSEATLATVTVTNEGSIGLTID